MCSKRNRAPIASVEDISLGSNGKSRDDIKRMFFTTNVTNNNFFVFAANLCEDNNRRTACNYQKLLGQLEEPLDENAIFQVPKDFVGNSN